MHGRNFSINKVQSLSARFRPDILPIDVQQPFRSRSAADILPIQKQYPDIFEIRTHTVAIQYQQVASDDRGSIEIVDPWARSATLEGGNSAVYMVLRNTSDTADKLIAVSGDVANAVELHESSMENGVMSMHPVEGGLEVPAKGSIELKPGGYHIMLIGLSKVLKAGDMVTIKLAFESGASVDVMAPVMDPK